MKLDLVITGVGGQGTVLASRVIAQAAMRQGYEVRTSETIGMAQREGSVVSYVRIGSELHGALIPDGKADILLSFELAETVRGLTKLKPEGTIIASTGKVIPPSVPLGLSIYDESGIKASFFRRAGCVMLVEAREAALRAGSLKTANVVLLGVLSRLGGLPFSADSLLDVILESVPTKVVEMNRRAFEIGRELGGMTNGG